ncbi:MAG: DUF2628 domain-containing protein [Ruminococcus sp.]|nr:DUF2628 domain-containing protein [Ruminococcus sp.]
MEFKGLECPVCDIAVKDGDDIVVCPDCGAPHHRECWEKENRCACEDRHGEDFDYSRDTDNQPDITVCPVCSQENAKDAFYCSKCGTPLNTGTQQTYQNRNQNNTNPFASAFDPMAGVDPEEDMSGVTAGELAKFVGSSTQYFMRVFNKIKTFGRSKFSFCAFIFNGFYLLYRKMYKLGAIIASVMILMMLAEMYIQYSPAYSALSKAIEASASTATGYLSGYTSVLNAYMSLDFNNQVLIFIMMMCSSLRLGIQIVVGIFANRWYFRHCRTQVKSIKENSENPNKEIEKKGGVNLAPAISLGAIYAAIYLIPFFIFGY